jgi:hypothetical protein
MIPYAVKMRLTPVGYPMAVENRGFWPCEIANAAHDMYQIEGDESPQPQVVVDVG